MSSSDGDPLSEAMNMLDQLGGDNDVGGDDDGDLDFEDFAIDSDDDELMMEEDLNGDATATATAPATATAGGGGTVTDAGNNASTVPNNANGHATTNSNAGPPSSFQKGGTTPLGGGSSSSSSSPSSSLSSSVKQQQQQYGNTTNSEPPPSHWATEEDALAMPDSTAGGAVGGSSSPPKNGSNKARATATAPSNSFVHPLQDVGAVGTASPSASGVGRGNNNGSFAGGGGGGAGASWTAFSSNFASFASRAAASVQNAVETAEAAVLNNNNNGLAADAAGAAAGGGGGGGGSKNSKPAIVPSTAMSYQERQRLLHQKYRNANNNNHNNTNASTDNAVAAIDGVAQSTSSTHSSSSSSSSSPSKTTVPSTNASAATTATATTTTPTPPNLSTPHQPSSIPPPTAAASTIMPPPPPSAPPSAPPPPPPPPATTTFLEKLTASLDTPTKTKLISSALGQLLPGERVIMFLNSLRDVRDSRFPQLMVGSDDVLGESLKNFLLCEENNGGRGHGGGSNGHGGISDGGGGEETTVTVWCCLMTFYRVAVFSYQSTPDGRVLLCNDEVGVGQENNEIMGDIKDKATTTTTTNTNSSSSKKSNQEGIIQQWIQSQSVSIQFQEAHSPSQEHAHNPTLGQKHRVFQMPLASIERVEKIMSTAQKSSAAGATPSSSSYSNYPGILPSSSTAVSSASSAMSSLGSQMKPLLSAGGLNSLSGAGSSIMGGGSNLLSISNNASSTANGGNGGLNNMNAATSSGPLGLVLHGKDGGRWIKFSTNSYSDAMRAHESLQTYAFPGRRNLGYLFAFESRRAEVMASGAGGGDGQVVSSGGTGDGGQPGGNPVANAAPTTRRRFVPMEEFERQGIFPASRASSSPWVPINANSTYGLCASYPSVLVGPRSIVGGNPTGNSSDNGLGLLRRCAAFRSENRLPTLSWGSANDGGSIWRSSQPKVGLQGNRSTEDEQYLYAIGEEAKRANLAADARAAGGVGGGSDAKNRPPLEFLRMLCGRNNEADLVMDGSNSCMMKIMDMRPKSAAMANRTQGYGYENTNNYRGSTINFYGIGNIHAVRDAYQKVCALCLSPNTSDIQWMQLVENTSWPSMTRLILSASWQTAFHVHYNRLPILLHCSHGWDRTSQVSALAQLLLDPHYRTREGFSALVEKDFLSFGHPFHKRCGHGEGKNEQGGDEGQLSPIFLQFLDCVFQLVNQFPDYFEFNTRYILLLSEHIYSCRFGTLLCDSEREREVVAAIRQRTYCMWEYLDSTPDLINPMFDKAVSKKAGVLLMPLPMLLRNVTLWVDRFCMYGGKASIPCVSHGLHPYQPQYIANNNMEQASVIYTVRAGAEGILRRALEDAEMWRGTALSALKEVEELRTKVPKEENGKEGEIISSSEPFSI